MDRADELAQAVRDGASIDEIVERFPGVSVSEVDAAMTMAMGPREVRHTERVGLPYLAPSDDDQEER
jgi:hypothetical protein